MLRTLRQKNSARASTSEVTLINKLSNNGFIIFSSSVTDSRLSLSAGSFF